MANENMNIICAGQDTARPAPKRMRPIYYHCTKWEDWQNGMMRTVGMANDDELVDKSAALLSNQSALYKAMSRVVCEWPIATEERLTKIDTNRRAWLGWAACCIEHGSPDMLTRKAWGRLSDDQQKAANLIAEKIIFEFESVHGTMEESCQLSIWD